MSAAGWLAVVALVWLAGLTVVAVKSRKLLRRRQKEHGRRLEALNSSLARQLRLMGEAAAGDLDSTSKIPAVSRAEDAQDVVLWELFGRQRRGVYIEAGAVDGEFLSMTAFLEGVGWRGVLVEPIPGMAEACAANRPGSTVAQAALGPAGATGTARFLVVGDNATDHGRSSLESSLDGLRDVRKDRVSGETIEVPVRPIADVLRDAGVGAVDLFALDVEGGEPDVIRGYDFEANPCRVFVIEDLSQGKDAQARRMLEERGYVLAGRMGENDVLIHRNEDQLLARARRMFA